MQLAGEEWRLQQLILSYHVPSSSALTPDDASFSPQQTPFDLLLSSALPLGLGHPRFLFDTQLVVTSTSEHPIDAQHSHPHTPASSSSSLSSHAGQPSRSPFRYSSQRKQAADCVVIESVYCMGCEGYIPLGDYVEHLENCSVGPMTTPDQRVTVIVPYEEEMEDEVRPCPMFSRHWTAEEERQADSLLQASAAASALQTEKIAGMEGRLASAHLAEKPSAHTKNGTVHPQPDRALHQHSLQSRLPRPQPLAASSTPLPASSQASAVASATHTADVEPGLPPPAVSLCSSPANVTRYHRFLNPAMFPSLLCGYPLLCGAPWSPSYTHCREVRMHCPDHAGWEDQWRLERRRRRVVLLGRMLAIRDDIAALSSLLHARLHGVDQPPLPPITSLTEKRQQSGDGAAQAEVEETIADADSEADSAVDDDGELSLDDADGDVVEQQRGHKRRDGRGASLSSSSSDDSPAFSSPSSLLPHSSSSLLSGPLSSSAKKEKDRERVRERERLNKQRQRERAKTREREKEVRAREKERSRERKKERKKKKREEREREKREKKREKEKERDRGRERERKKRANGGGGGGSSGHQQSASRNRRDDSHSDDTDESDSSDSQFSDNASSSSDHHHA